MFGIDPAELLQSYGYIALTVGAFLEGELIVLLAGILVHQGYLELVPAILCAFGGSFISDQLMFYLGRWKGNSILRRFPRLEKKAGKVHVLLARYETPLILGFRFIYGVRNVTPILLGMGSVNHWKFLVLNFFSAGAWAVIVVSGGYFFGRVLTAFLEAHPHTEKLLLLVFISVVAGIWLWHRWWKKKKVGNAKVA